MILDTKNPIVNIEPNKLKIGGCLINYDGEKFWTAIHNHILDNNITTVDFELEYITTQSVRDLLQLLNSSGDLEVNWIYQDFDIDMKELGEDLEMVSCKRFNLIQK